MVPSALLSSPAPPLTPSVVVAGGQQQLPSPSNSPPLLMNQSANTSNNAPQTQQQHTQATNASNGYAMSSYPPMYMGGGAFLSPSPTGPNGSMLLPPHPQHSLHTPQMLYHPYMNTSFLGNHGGANNGMSFPLPPQMAYLAQGQGGQAPSQKLDLSNGGMLGGPLAVPPPPPAPLPLTPPSSVAAPSPGLRLSARCPICANIFAYAADLVSAATPTAADVLCPMCHTPIKLPPQQQQQQQQQQHQQTIKPPFGSAPMNAMDANVLAAMQIKQQQQQQQQQLMQQHQVANNNLFLFNPTAAAAAAATLLQSHPPGVLPSPPHLLPASLSSKELAQHESAYYTFLADYVADFDSPNSALVWLARAVPSRTFKLAVPKQFRLPKSSAGQGGYCEAFIACGLVLREADTNTGHWHSWYADPRRVSLKALQAALMRRWKESPHFNESMLTASNTGKEAGGSAGGEAESDAAISHTAIDSASHSSMYTGATTLPMSESSAPSVTAGLVLSNPAEGVRVPSDGGISGPTAQGVTNALASLFAAADESTASNGRRSGDETVPVQFPARAWALKDSTLLACIRAARAYNAALPAARQPRIDASMRNGADEWQSATGTPAATSTVAVPASAISVAPTASSSSPPASSAVATALAPTSTAAATAVPSSTKPSVTPPLATTDSSAAATTTNLMEDVAPAPSPPSSSSSSSLSSSSQDTPRRSVKRKQDDATIGSGLLFSPLSPLTSPVVPAVAATASSSLAQETMGTGSATAAATSLSSSGASSTVLPSMVSDFASPGALSHAARRSAEDSDLRRHIAHKRLALESASSRMPTPAPLFSSPSRESSSSIPAVAPSAAASVPAIGGDVAEAAGIAPAPSAGPVLSVSPTNDVSQVGAGTSMGSPSVALVSSPPTMASPPALTTGTGTSSAAPDAPRLPAAAMTTVGAADATVAASANANPIADSNVGASSMNGV